MASINKSDYWKDRRGTHGKGDLPREGSERAYWDSTYWKRSKCCNDKVKISSRGITHFYYCVRCKRDCDIK